MVLFACRWYVEIRVFFVICLKFAIKRLHSPFMASVLKGRAKAGHSGNGLGRYRPNSIGLRKPIRPDRRLSLEPLRLSSPDQNLEY